MLKVLHSQRKERVCYKRVPDGRSKVQANGNMGSEGAEEPQGRVQEETKYNKNRKDLDNY